MTVRHWFRVEVIQDADIVPGWRIGPASAVIEAVKRFFMREMSKPSQIDMVNVNQRFSCHLTDEVDAMTDGAQMETSKELPQHPRTQPRSCSVLRKGTLPYSNSSHVQPLRIIPASPSFPFPSRDAPPNWLLMLDFFTKPRRFIRALPLGAPKKKNEALVRPSNNHCLEPQL